jgi:hypothetical protein
MKTTNALVTYTDLTTMGLVAKGTPATGNRIATVSFINSNYYVNQSASPYNTYSSLRCPPYQNIIAGPTNSGTMYYLTNNGGGNLIGFNSASDACAHASGGSIIVYWYGTFGNGTVIYLNSDGGNIDAGGFFSLNGYSFQTDVNAVYDYTVCSAPSGVVFNVTSGLYPVSGTSSTCIGNLVNNTGGIIFVRGLFNSAGLNSGTVSGDRAYYQSYYIEVSGATISTSGQNIYTNTGTQAPFTGYAVLTAGQTMSFTLDKFDGFGSGTTFRLAYSTVTANGPFTTI